jgi:adenylyl cyclase-associated protein
MTQTNEAKRAPIQVHSNVLTAYLRRLEAATSRLEDIASSSAGPESGAANGTSGAPTQGTAATAASEAVPTKAVESLPPSMQAYDALIDTELAEWMTLSGKLGEVIDGQVRRGDTLE